MNKVKSILIIFWSLFSIINSVAQTYNGSKESILRDSGGQPILNQEQFDVTFYDLDLNIDPDKKWIGGSLEMKALALDDLDLIILNLDSLLNIEQIELHDIRIENWNAKNGLIYIYPSESIKRSSFFELKISYSGHPLTVKNARRGSFDDGFYFEKTSDGSHWITVVSVLTGSDIWWPCKDAPYDEADSMSIRITTQDDLEVISNGKQIETIQNTDSTKTHHWFVSYPINNYAITLHIGPFVKLTAELNSVDGNTYPYSLWVLPEYYDKASQYFPEMTKDLVFLENLLGPFPFWDDKCASIQTYHIGMENQSATSFGSHFGPHYCGFNITHMHELAHEWIANLVTISDWKDMWIHEGVATYIEMLYTEEIGGEFTYQDFVNRRLNQIKNKMPIVSSQNYVSIREAMHMDVYYKGALVLHTLRFLIGKETLIKSLREFIYPEGYSKETKGRSNARFTSTQEFIEVVEKNYSENLDWYFDNYLYYPEPPTLTVVDTGNIIQLNWTSKSDSTFQMPIPVEIDGIMHRIEMINGRAEVNTNGKQYQIDPNNEVLKILKTIE